MGFLLLSILPIIIFIAIGVAVIAVIVSIVRLSSKRNANQTMTEEEGKEMLKNIYVYLVLFATLMMSIGGAVGVFTGVADYLVPSAYMEPADSLRLIIKSFGWIIIPFPVFLYYNKQRTGRNLNEDV